MPEMRVSYDITRLLERMDAQHPTGVDRVDLHYALWTRSRANQWVGFVQRANGFVVLTDTICDDLLRQLRVRWLNAGVDELQSCKVVKSKSSKVTVVKSRTVGGLLVLLEKFRRVGFRELCSERGLFAALASRLLVWPFKKPAVFPVGDWQGWTYVNVGHCFRFESAMEAIPLEMKRLYFLHDVIPLTHPETQKATSRSHFRKFCEYVGHPNSDVIVSSQATVDAIGTLPDRERKLLDSVASTQVCPLAVEERFMAQRLEGLKGNQAADFQASDYFLSVGTIEPRKNLELLVRVWEQLVESGNALPKLIWVGKFGWSCGKQLMRRFERLQQQGCAELRSGVSDPELLYLMAGATALLFPSKIEGWGLPLSEALAMGLPIIASRIAVFEEVGQGIPELLELDDLDAWKSMILNYAATDSSLRAKQIQRMQCYQPLAWTQHFKQLETLWGSLRP